MIMYPLATEKAIGAIDSKNEIMYIVSLDSTKLQIKKEFEEMFNVKVDSVRIINTPINEKKAIIRLKKNYKASDIAVKLKLV